MIVQLRTGISNAFVLQGAKKVLVDMGSRRDITGLIQTLHREGINTGDVSLILHTHGHADHCASTWRSKQTIAAPVAIHHADAQMLRRGVNYPLRPTRLSGRILKPFVDRPVQGAEPDILIEQETDLGPFGVEARVIFTPGHTPGSISIITGEGEAIVGDIIMGGHLGGVLFSHRPRYHYFADDLDQVRNSIKKVMNYAPRKIYVGHGGPLDPDAVLERFSREIDF